MKAAPYDAIAERYRDSKRLPFCHSVERYTLVELLGDLRGRTVLDLACGNGVYARLCKRSGAAAATGVDISKQMIALAEAEERKDPLGCRYVCEDAATFTPPTQVDIVVAVYLLNYARTRDELDRFFRACYRALRPEGRLVGFNNNMRRPPRAGVSLAKYGFERTCPDLRVPGADTPLNELTGRQFARARTLRNRKAPEKRKANTDRERLARPPSSSASTACRPFRRRLPRRSRRGLQFRRGRTDPDVQARGLERLTRPSRGSSRRNLTLPGNAAAVHDPYSCSTSLCPRALSAIPRRQRSP